jgi:hypothetical protein
LFSPGWIAYFMNNYLFKFYIVCTCHAANIKEAPNPLRGVKINSGFTLNY